MTVHIYYMDGEKFYRLSGNIEKYIRLKLLAKVAVERNILRISKVVFFKKKRK